MKDLLFVEWLKFTQPKRKEKWTERERMGGAASEGGCFLCWLRPECSRLVLRRAVAWTGRGIRGGVQLWGHVAQFL